MLSSPALALIVSVYFFGIFVRVSHNLLRISELKSLYDLTRVKDTKNESAALTRLYFSGITRCWIWPVDMVLSLRLLKWAYSLDKK